jgi:hypothetical protein
MKEGLTVTDIGGDPDFEEYRIQASNGAFSGAVYVYAEPGVALWPIRPYSHGGLRGAAFLV